MFVMTSCLAVHELCISVSFGYNPASSFPSISQEKLCNTQQDLCECLDCSSQAAHVISAVSDRMLHSHRALVQRCCTLISSVFLLDLWCLSRQALDIWQAMPSAM